MRGNKTSILTIKRKSRKGHDNGYLGSTFLVHKLLNARHK